MAKKSEGAPAEAPAAKKPRKPREKQALVYQVRPHGVKDAQFVDVGPLTETDYPGGVKEVLEVAAGAPEQYEGKEVRIIAVKGSFVLKKQTKLTAVAGA